ncbi:MAG: hypothetical protein RL456_3195, partial [Pseudomonadota bacterium]
RKEARWLDAGRDHGAASCRSARLRWQSGPASRSALQQVVSASSGQSWIGDDRLPRALAGDHAPRAHAHILTKDLTLALQMLQAAGEASPFGEAALAVFRRACETGRAGLDDGVVLDVLRQSAPRPVSGD